jgi:hypothetical protein
VETVFDTFATSYHHALQAVVQKVARDHLGEATLQLYTTAEQLASKALETLRHATLLNTNPQHADEIANQGIDLLKQRYTFNNMTRIKFPAFTLFRTRMLLISWLHGFYVNGIQLQAYDPPLTLVSSLHLCACLLKGVGDRGSGKGYGRTGGRCATDGACGELKLSNG